MEQQPQQTIDFPITASKDRRFMNYVIDMALYNIVSYFLIIPFALLIFEDSPLARYLISLLIGYTFLFLYYFTLETFFQKTIGKFITGTKVVMLDGSKPGARKIAIRSLVRLIPWEAISMYTGKLIEKKGTWWHDQWSKTRVIRD